MLHPLAAHVPRLRSTATTAAALALLTLSSGCAVLMLTLSPAGASTASVLSIGAPASAEGLTLEPAERLDPPAAQPVVIPAGDSASASPGADSAAPTPVVNASNCRGDLSGAVMMITIPEISYACPVYAGGQKMLDAGAVTSITDPALDQVLADHPGQAGTLWIAGHRTSHGGAFAAVPNLSDGSIITLSDAVSTASYVVVGRVYVSIVNDQVVAASGRATSAATVEAILRTDLGANGAPRLLLQTCDGANQRWLIYADLVV